MPNLEDILKMFKTSMEKESNANNSVWELAKIGKAQYQALINSKSQMEPQAQGKEPDIMKKIEDEKTKRKNSSNKIIMNSNSQNNPGLLGNNSLNGNEIFSYDFTNDDLVKGFIFSEVLGRPKSKTRDKSFRGRRAR